MYTYIGSEMITEINLIRLNMHTNEKIGEQHLAIIMLVLIMQKNMENRLRILRCGWMTVDHIFNSMEL